MCFFNQLNHQMNHQVGSALFGCLSIHTIAQNCKKQKLLDSVNYTLEKNDSYSWVIQFILVDMETYINFGIFKPIYFKKVLYELISISFRSTINENSLEINIGGLRDLDPQMKGFIEHLYYKNIETEYMALEESPIPSILSIVSTLYAFSGNLKFEDIENEIYKKGTIVSQKNTNVSICSAFLYSFVLYQVLIKNENFLKADLDIQILQMKNYMIKTEQKLNISTEKISVLNLLNLLLTEYQKKKSLNIFNILSMVVDFIKDKTSYTIRSPNDWHPLCCVMTSIMTFLNYKDHNVKSALKIVFTQGGNIEVVGALLGALFGAYDEKLISSMDINEKSIIENIPYGSKITFFLNQFVNFASKHQTTNIANYVVDLEEDVELKLLETQKSEKSRPFLENKFKDDLINFIDLIKDKQYSVERCFEEFYRYYFPKSKLLSEEERRKIFVVIFRELIKKK